MTTESSGVSRIWQRGAWRARRARAYNGGLGAEPPAGSRVRAPGRGWEGRSPLKLKHFLLLNVQWKPHIRPFFLKFENAENHSVISDAISHGDFNRILYMCEKRPSNIVELCNSCWKTAKRIFSYKVACKKFSWLGQRRGIAPYPP